VDGSAQTYFSATDAQKADLYANTLGQLPDSIAYGKNLRDETRLENLSARNGAAAPDHTLEELLIGGKLVDKVAGTIGKAIAKIVGEDVAVVGADAAKNGDINVWHSTGNSNAVTNILEKGIDPNYLNPSSRFGKAFYVAEQPATSIAEMNHYGVDPTTGIRFNIDMSQAKVLDLTDPVIAQQWGYVGGEKTLQMQQIGNNAKSNGYNVIRFNSERSTEGTNFAILDNFNQVLKPQMVTPVKK
jgi:hypothetical protein